MGSVVTNTPGGAIDVDLGSTLSLHNTTIDGAPIIDNGTIDLTGADVIKNGTLNISATGHLDVSGADNALDNDTVTNTGTVTVNAGATLTLDQNSSVANDTGTITVKDNGTLNVDTASIDKGTVNVHADDADGVDAGTVPGILNLKGSAVLTNGTLVNGGTIAVASAGNELDHENITNTGTITVAAGADLVIDAPAR